MAVNSIIKTEKYKKERLEQNQKLKEWRSSEKTRELFEKNLFSATNNNGLYDIIKDQMNSGNIELIQNIRQNLTSGTTQYINKKSVPLYRILKISDFLKEMGFTQVNFPENTRESSKIAIEKKGYKGRLERIAKWFEKKENQEYINTITEEKNYYPAESVKIIKSIYEVIENKNNENKEELNKILKKYFNKNINEVQELNLYKKYSFNNKIEENLSNINKKELIDFNEQDLIKALTKSDDILNNDNSTIELFVSKVLNMELSEIKGWLISSVRADFEDIKKIILESNDDINEMKTNIFTFINSRSITIENNKISEPFKFNEDGSIDFSIAVRGTPDVLYFPKNEDKKPITSLNITSDPNKKNTILQHSLKAFIIGNKVLETSKKNNLNIDNILYEYKNNYSKHKKSIGNIINVVNDRELLSFVLKNKDVINVENVFKNFDFSLVLNDASLSIYNMKKISNNQRNLVDKNYLDKIEKQNVLVYAFSQVSIEDKIIDALNIHNKEEKIYLKNFLNKIIENIDISILSNEGNLTTLNKQDINSYAKNLANLYTNKKEFEDYLELNKKNSDNSFSEKFHQAVTKSFIYLLNDNIGLKFLIQNIANGGDINFNNFIKKDEINNLDTLTLTINKIIKDNENQNKLNNTTNTIEKTEKIKNLNKLVSKIEDFKYEFVSRDCEEELKDIL